jgi:2-oxoglutarate dehydrogenase E2 component (dihydrolipoamide succinyltransferase)
MAIEIKIPEFPESVSEGTLLSWHKKEGEFVEQDELLLEIETDKIVLEVAATEAGIVKNTSAGEGDIVTSGQVVGSLEAGAKPSSAAASSSNAATTSVTTGATNAEKISPAARNLINEHKLDAANITATGNKGAITKEDVLKHIAAQANSSQTNNNKSSAPGAQAQAGAANAGARFEERVPMRGLRKTIAKRLVQSKQETAMLTTFNEVNMEAVMTLRKKYKEEFTEKHEGTRLGFMSFFTKAAVHALKKFPEVNASIEKDIDEKDEIVYHGYQDIGIAVSSPRGLVVPILRNVELMSIAQIENNIASYAGKAKNNSLGLDEITGGTFTISNGGVFGSLLSTPIINPPQTAILGMHTIQQRPIAVNGEVVIKPMMYLALSYDHRLIDGSQAVQFLISIKDCIEDPARMLLEI